MSDIKITITGMGGILNRPLDVIVKALQDAGCEVTVKNEYPRTENDWVRKDGDLSMFKATVIAEHLPWGG